MSAKPAPTVPTVYGIRNCDTVKKARAWLDKHGVAYRFHDYNSAGIMPVLLDDWCRARGWELLLNRAGTTFRRLPDADKQGIGSARARALMLGQPSMIKRPVLVHGDELLIGFDPEAYERVLRTVPQAPAPRKTP